MTNNICPRCKGNGFFKVKESVDNKVDLNPWATIERIVIQNGS